MHRVLVALTGLLMLVGCQSGNTVPTSFSSASGDIVVPPAAGKAQWHGVTGAGQPFALASANVDRSGHFNLSLPHPPPALPAQGNAALLPYSPSAELVEFKQFSCPQSPAVSDAGARLVLVKLGSYQVGGQLTGQLLPAMTTVSGTSDVEREVTTETYAYADRAVTVSGVLNCTLTRQSGSAVMQVKVNYALQRGWNKVTVRTTLTQSGQVGVQTQASTNLDGVQWRYLPVTP